MSKRFCIAFIVGIGLFAPLCFGQDVLAVSAFISKAGEEPLNPAHPTVCQAVSTHITARSTFSVTFTDGWKAQGLFKCDKLGCPEPSSVKDFSPPGESGCFPITLEPTLPGAQTLSGVICKENTGTQPPTPVVPTGNCGAFTPSSYYNGETSVVSKVRNTSAGYNNWVDSVWAKPTDKIDWIHCYYPGVQAKANLQITGTAYNNPKAGTHTHADHGSWYTYGGRVNLNTTRDISTFFTWQNTFSVSASNLRNPSPNSASGETGETAIKQINDTYTIPANTPATSVLKETSRSGEPISASRYNDKPHTWGCNYKYNDCASCGGGECVYGWKEDPSWLPNPFRGNKRTINPVTLQEEWTCLYLTPCKSCNDICTHSNEYWIGEVNRGPASDNALVNIPYNFNNMASAAFSTSNTYVYAGETTGFSAEAVVAPRYNGVTKGSYATRVDNAMVGIVVYTTDNPSGGAKSSVGSGTGYDLCNAVNHDGWCPRPQKKSGGHTLNSTNNYYGSVFNVNNVLGNMIDIADARAGKYFCIAAAVYPANSGYDTNMSSSSGSNSWYVSAPDCRKIAKKPSLQVWGAGMYTADKIIVPYAQKHVVAGGFQDYNWSTTANIVFGSWVEQNIVANGLVDISSGAADGWRGGSAFRSKGDFGGSYNNNIALERCALHVLTMPNKNCTEGAGAGVGGTANSMERPGDKEVLLERFVDKEIIGSDFERHDDVCAISEAPGFESTKTHVYKCNGDFSINGNIEYSRNNETYSGLIDIPKIIIYATGNIVIACDIEQVDAVLIAGGDVNTCPDNDVNSSARSTQLKINGVIISNKLLANRTYGAGAGNNSGVPAEIINYDTSLYLWGASRAAASETGKLITVYQSELAPRL